MEVAQYGYSWFYHITLLAILYCTLLMNYSMYHLSTSGTQNYNVSLKINFTLVLNFQNNRQSLRWLLFGIACYQLYPPTRLYCIFFENPHTILNYLFLKHEGVCCVMLSLDHTKVLQCLRNRLSLIRRALRLTGVLRRICLIIILTLDNTAILLYLSNIEGDDTFNLLYSYTYALICS